MLVAATGYGGLGILNMNTDAWTVFNTDNSNIPSNGVWDAAISDNGDIWIVGLASGLSVLPGYLTTSVNQVRADNPFRVYPNPADKVLQVDYTGKEKATYTLSLVATDGGDKLIVTGYTSTGIIQKTLDVSGVAPGAYLLRITGQKIMATTKLVIK
jgi:hypothetical protein